jgi:geranylgeranyl diphosphate synthase, type I
VDSLAERVDATLAGFLDARARSLDCVGPEMESLTAEARQFVLGGGKRLRPRFAYWGWRAARDDGDGDEALVTAASALELLHACALVHDDVMDASDTRRGRPAAHAAFAVRHRAAGWPGDADVFGAAAAILLGDLLLSWADALFASAQPTAAARAVFDDMRQLVMAGQYLDVLVQARGAFSVEDALRVAKFKTSKYTVEGPLHLGAAIGDAPPEIFEALSAYAIPLGEAFQLRDDVLGVFGDPMETGKPAGDDLLEGKRTLLVALAVQAASAADAASMRTDLGRRDMDAARIHDLRRIIVDSGALDQVEHRIAERTAQARAALHAIPSDDVRQALDELAVAATQRIA